MMETFPKLKLAKNRDQAFLAFVPWLMTPEVESPFGNFILRRFFLIRLPTNALYISLR